MYPTSEKFGLGTLTLGRYAHIEFLDRAEALAVLPSTDAAPEGIEAARATGTDGESVSDDDEPSACSVPLSHHCPGTPSGALLGKATRQGDNLDNGGRTR